MVFELTLACLLLMGGFLAAFTWFALAWQRSAIISEVERGVLLASDTLYNSLRDGMMRHDRESVRRALDLVGEDERFGHIRLIGHDGNVVMSTLEADQTTVSEEACTICHDEDTGGSARSTPQPGSRVLQENHSLRTFTPVLPEQGCLGEGCHPADSGMLGLIDANLSLDEMEQTLRSHFLRLGGLAVGTLLVCGFLLLFAVSGRLRRPMRELLLGIRRMGDGDLQHRIPVRRRDEVGELALAFNNMSDRLVAVQRQLIDSERLISMGRLAAGVAHEINNPLAGILSYAEALVEDAQSNDPLLEDYVVIHHEALRCRRIVRDLLEFARQDAPSFGAVSIGQVAERAIKVVARQATFHDIEIIQTIKPSLPLVEGDSVQLQQVMINLIINAQQAMPKGGKITIGAAQGKRPEEVSFWVSDEGPGVPPDMRKRIFEPFYSTKQGRTSGLGLAVCHGIVDSHGGSIEIDEHDGKGATFRVNLPLKQKSIE